MDRRNFIKASVIGGTAAAAGTTLWLSTEPNRKALSIDIVLAKLKALSGRTLSATGEWNSYQIFNHLAQSVEYSMSGYPIHKSDIFKQTVGAAAFTVFAAKGSMTHNLDEVIPGAPELVDGSNVSAAITRLENALHQFSQHTGPFQPHFAYGELSKSEYEAAHVLHINNHLEEIII